MSISRTPLHTAILSKDRVKIKALLQAGADLSVPAQFTVDEFTTTYCQKYTPGSQYMRDILKHHTHPDNSEMLCFSVDALLLHFGMQDIIDFLSESRLRKAKGLESVLSRFTGIMRKVLPLIQESSKTELSMFIDENLLPECETVFELLESVFEFESNLYDNRLITFLLLSTYNDVGNRTLAFLEYLAAYDIASANKTAELLVRFPLGDKIIPVQILLDSIHNSKRKNLFLLLKALAKSADLDTYLNTIETIYRSLEYTFSHNPYTTSIQKRASSIYGTDAIDSLIDILDYLIKERGLNPKCALPFFRFYTGNYPPGKNLIDVALASGNEASTLKILKFFDRLIALGVDTKQITLLLPRDYNELIELNRDNAKLKQYIIKHIESLPVREGITACEHALNKDHPLGHIMHMKSSWRKPSTWHGELNRIYHIHAHGVEVLNKVNAPIDPEQSQTIHLWDAAQKGDLNKVKNQLFGGADINCRNISLATPLIIAAENGHTNVVELLLKEGAFIEARDSADSTALNQAAQNGRLACVKLLLDAGANIESRRDQKHESCSPIEVAVRNRHTEVVRLLLRYGADHSNALNIAKELGFAEIANILQEYIELHEPDESEPVLTNPEPATSTPTASFDIAELPITEAEAVEIGPDVPEPQLDEFDLLLEASRRYNVQDPEMQRRLGMFNTLMGNDLLSFTPPPASPDEFDALLEASRRHQVIDEEYEEKLMIYRMTLMPDVKDTAKVSTTGIFAKPSPYTPPENVYNRQFSATPGKTILE